MIRLSKQADYAILLMSLAARRGADVTSSSSELARDARLAEPMTRKVLKMLSRSGLLSSQRGVAGGYQLARDASEVTITDIIQAVDGPIAITECADDAPSACGCHQEAVCVTKPHWLRINEAIRGALHGITLASMASSVDFGVPFAPRAGDLPPEGLLLTEDDVVPEATALAYQNPHSAPLGAPTTPNEIDPS